MKENRLIAEIEELKRQKSEVAGERQFWIKRRRFAEYAVDNEYCPKHDKEIYARECCFLWKKITELTIIWCNLEKEIQKLNYQLKRYWIQNKEEDQQVSEGGN